MGSGAAAGEGQQQDDQQQPADDEQGVQGEPPGDSGSHGSDNTASICLLTLAISPPELEAVFWREAGTPAYALADRYAYACTILNTVALWLNMRNASNATWLFDACPSAIIAAIRAAHVGPLYVAVASWALAVLLPAQYRVIREPLIIAQRLVRAINTPVSAHCPKRLVARSHMQSSRIIIHCSPHHHATACSPHAAARTACRHRRLHAVQACASPASCVHPACTLKSPCMRMASTAAAFDAAMHAHGPQTPPLMHTMAGLPRMHQQRGLRAPHRA